VHRRAKFSLALLCVLGLAGCQQREASPEFVYKDFVLLNGQKQELDEEFLPVIEEQVNTLTGSYDDPILFGNEDGDVPKEKLKLGQAVYQKRCVQCHGVSGDGNGPAAFVMYPKPRDYRLGIYKFTSTPYGQKPLHSDLVRTVVNGVRGTSMPAFKLLPEEEIEAVVDYVLMLTHRGEIEHQLGVMAISEGEIDPEWVQEDILPVVKSKWKTAAASQVSPMTPPPVFTKDHITRGREAFLSKGCVKCHGDDGRGQTPENLKGDLKDAWGNVTRAADLTSGMLHGGQRPIDVYRRIYSGINGTPMPAFANALQEEPDTIWDLVAYVLHVSNTRRMGVEHTPCKFAPYIPVETAEAGAAGDSVDVDAAE